MESPSYSYVEKQGSMSQTLSACGSTSTSTSTSGRRRKTRSSRESNSNSPEFEFWMLRNPSFPQPNLLSADQLFVDGVLLPLHLLHLHDPPDDPHPQPPNSEITNKSDPKPDSELDFSPPITALNNASKRWKDIFKKSDRKNSNNKDLDKDKEKKKERKAGGGGVSSAELNINLWPFSRSRSAGNRPKMAAGTAATRKVSSAPCSRSNSAGESKSRKWPSSPSRGGVHLGRSSPVWQVRRGGGSGWRSFEPPTEKGVLKEGNETRRKKPLPAYAAAGGGTKPARVLNLNVPMCIGYRQHLSCRSDESSAVNVAAVEAGGQSGGSGSGDGGRGGNLFNLRSLFTKKVH